MEFPGLGKKCSWPICNKLDFLPLICSYCKQIFCKDHLNQDVHECQQLTKTFNYSVEVKSFVCSVEECTTCSPVEMLCQKCQKHFCLVHRYHDCFDIVNDLEAQKQILNKPDEQFRESVKCLNETLNKKIQKAIQDPKKQATALKIQLMRLKGKAEGPLSISSTDRIYFLLLLPKGSKKSSKAIFVNKDWSVGKVIDSVSSICNIINKNNEVNAPKLRLFKATDGSQISSDMSIKITVLINQNQIVNGETLILEYIDCTEDLKTYKLSDLDQYKDSV